MEECSDQPILKQLSNMPGHPRECYVERTYRFQTFRLQIFSEDCPPFILFLTHTTRKELKLLGVAARKIHVAEVKGSPIGQEQWICVPQEKSKVSDEETFEKLRKENESTRSLHWVCFLDGALVWKKSSGSVADLVRFVDSKCSLVSQPHTELSVANERVVVVADEVGAGKSCLMDSISRKLAEESPLNRVFKFDLKIHAERREDRFCLGDINFQTHEIEEALDVVLKMIDFEKQADGIEFVTCCYRGTPAVVLIFDGYDEIDRRCQEKFLEFLKLLKNGSKVLIWVTTRFGEQVELETNLETLAISLEPLSKSQKVLYLDKYWKLKLKEFLNVCDFHSLEKLRSYLREMLREVEICMVTLPEKKRRFQILMLMNSLSQIVSVIIKLQSEEGKLEEDFGTVIREQINCLDFSGYAKVLLSVEKIMSAEDESQYISTPLNLFLMAEMTFNGKFQLPVVTNVNSIYEKFIETKYSAYYEKKNDNSLNVSNIYSSPEYFAHKEIALQLLLPDETSTATMNLLEKMEQEHLAGIGFVTQFESGFRFIHHSFTEFFFCDWVVSDLTNEEVQKLFVTRILCEPNFSMVRKFLNLQIENKQVSIPLSAKIVEETNILDLNNSKGTLLHLLAEECLGSIIEMLLSTFPEEAAGIILKTNSNLQNVLLIACDLRFNRIIELVLNFAKSHLTKEMTERLILQKDFWEESPFVSLQGKCFLCLFIDFLYDNNRKVENDVCLYFLEANLRDSETNILTKHLIMEYPETGDKLLSLAFNKFSQELYVEVVINQIDVHGNTCLHNLAYGGRIDSLVHFWEYAEKKLSEEELRQYLLQRNACGNTVMHEAALGSNGPVFHRLLQCAKLLMLKDEPVGDFLTATNAEGNTVLHEAVSKSKVDFLQEFLDAMDDEADLSTLRELLDQTNRSLDTVLHLASRRGDADVVEHACSYVRDVLGDEALRKFLLARNSKGYTAIHEAVEKGDADSLRILWDCADALLDKESLNRCLTETNKYGNSVFHSATSGTAPYVLKLLLEYAVGVLDNDGLRQVLIQDNMEGNTVMHLASVSGLVEIPAYWFDFAGLAVSKDDVEEVLAKANGDGDDVLHLAVRRGEAGVLKHACSQLKEMLGGESFGKLLVSVDSREQTLVHLAVIRRVEEILVLVLETVRDGVGSEGLAKLVRRATEDGDTAFHLGVTAGNPRIMEVLFDLVSGEIFGDVDSKDLLTYFNSQGKSALQLAYDRGDFEAVKLMCTLSGETLTDESLLEFFMNINSFGETFLHLAVHLEGPDMMTEWCAFVRTLLNPTLMEILLMVPNQNGDTVLHYAVRLRNCDGILFWFGLAKEVLAPDSMKEVLRKRNNMGDTILHLISSVGDTTVVRYVCQHLKEFQGEDTLKWMLIQRNKNGESALHLIVRKCELAVVTFWLDFVREELGVEFLAELLPETNSNGESVLHVGVLRDDVDVVRQLCACAVDVLDHDTMKNFLTRKAKNGSNVLHSIVTRGNILMMKEFWECCIGVLPGDSLESFIIETNGGDDTLLHLATTRGKISILNQTFIYMKDHLSKQSAKDVMMKRNFEGNVNLHIAVSKGRIDLLTRLWDWHNELLSDEESSDEFILSTTSRGNTVLHLGTLRGEIIFLNQLCEWCEEKLSKESLRILVLLPDKNGSTCLHLATSEGETSVVTRIFDYARGVLEEQQLVSFFKKPNEDRDTALHTGVRRGKLSITMYLCDYAKQILDGDSIKRLLMRSNCHGKTVMDEAMMRGRNYYVESLWDYANNKAKGNREAEEYRSRKAARAPQCSTF